MGQEISYTGIKVLLNASHCGTAKIKCKTTPKQVDMVIKFPLLRRPNMYHPNLHSKWSTASVIQKKKARGEKMWHRNMKTLPYNDKSQKKNWASGHLAQSHTCQASLLLGDNCSSASFHWDAAVSCLDSKQAFIALGKGQHAVAQAPHPGWQQVLLLQRAVAQPSLKLSQSCFKVGAPRSFLHWDYWGKSRRGLCLFPPS